MQDWNEITMMNADALRKRMRILAALDIIFSEEEWLRVHHYEDKLQPGVAWGSINNGAGDHLHVLFTDSGTLIKGFDHESPLSPHAREDGEIYPGMYDEVPETLMAVLRDQEETLDMEDVTFCLWQEGNDLPWKVGNWIQLAMTEEDEADARGGAEFLLGYLNKKSEDYADWAKGYYDFPDLPLEAVAEVYEGKPVTARLIKQLCPERDVAAALDELQQREYAVGQT
ncbi:hypothetical protein [Paenibacillus amylolyticus]|uniref:hypothetical protein n=1 Tax=Paenibacillus amylolyticus TaxID=1451 RepID=UPI00201D4EF2|nr:hypothetical protein [Paenibacillus amylolyticus]MCL6660984.1 hypothetical protein [Paenibacillus amylolyticus]